MEWFTDARSHRIQPGATIALLVSIVQDVLRLIRPRALFGSLRSCRNEYFMRAHIYAQTGILNHVLLTLPDDCRAAFSIVLVRRTGADGRRRGQLRSCAKPGSGRATARRHSAVGTQTARPRSSGRWPQERPSAMPSSPARRPGCAGARRVKIVPLGPTAAVRGLCSDRPSARALIWQLCRAGADMQD